MIFGKTFKVIFFGIRPKKWLGTERLKEEGKVVKKIYGRLASKARAKKESITFEESMKKYNLDEAGLKVRMRNALYITAFCSLGSLFTFGYMFFEFANGLILAGFMCLVLTLMLWVYALREHMNYLQMKRRKLGCTVKEWLVFVCQQTKKGKGTEK